MKLGHRFVVGYRRRYSRNAWMCSITNIYNAPIQRRLESVSAFREYKSAKAFARMLKWEFRL